MRRSQSAVELRSMNSLARHSSASDLSQLEQVRPQRLPGSPAVAACAWLPAGLHVAELVQTRSW